MILDRQALVSSQQALSGTGNLVSTDTVDLGPSPRDVNLSSDELQSWIINVDVTAAGGVSLTPQIVSSANADLSSPTVLQQGPAIPLASLVAGFSTELRLPRTLVPLGQRYIGLIYVRSGTFTAGAVTAGPTSAFQDRNKNYATGFAVV